MILDRQEILDYLKEIKPELEAEGITNLGLFGSYARDEATDDSDIDICCIFTKEHKQKYPHLGYLSEKRKLKEKISARFHNKKIDLISLLGMNEFMLEAVREDVIYV